VDDGLYKAGVDGRAGLEWSAGAEVLAQCQTGAESGGGWVGFCDSLQATKRQEILDALREAGEATAHLWEATSPADLEEALGCMWDDARFRAARARILGASKAFPSRAPVSEEELRELYRRLFGRGAFKIARLFAHTHALRGRLLAYTKHNEQGAGWTLEDAVERPESPSGLRRLGLDGFEMDAIFCALVQRQRVSLAVSEDALLWMRRATLQRSGRQVLFLAGCAQGLPEDLRAEVLGLREAFAGEGWAEVGSVEQMEREGSARAQMLERWFRETKERAEGTGSPWGAGLDEP
jgi:hypothetical protein